MSPPFRSIHPSETTVKLALSTAFLFDHVSDDSSPADFQFAAGIFKISEFSNPGKLVGEHPSAVAQDKQDRLIQFVDFVYKADNERFVFKRDSQPIFFFEPDQAATRVDLPKPAGADRSVSFLPVPVSGKSLKPGVFSFVKMYHYCSNLVEKPFIITRE